MPQAKPDTQQPDDSTDASMSPFAQQRAAVLRAAKNKQWPQAIAQAQQLLEKTLPDGNPYEQLDVSGLLYVLQHQQGMHAQNIQLADRMLAVAAGIPSGPVPGQVQALAQQGLTSATMVQDRAAVERFQQVLRQNTPLYPAQWQWDSAMQRLTFATAQLSVPTALDRWVLMEVEPASDRTDFSLLSYVYVKPNGQRIFASMRLQYDDGYTDLSRDARAQRLVEDLKRYTEDDEMRPSQQVPPDLSITGAQQLRKAVRMVSQHGEDELQMHWVAMRGNWSWHMELRAKHADHALATQAVTALWQAVQWPQAPNLPQAAEQPPLPWRESSIASTWRSAKDWGKAGQLARAALADARFPSEVARLHTVAGISAFKAQNYPEAQQYLDTALQAWPYASVFDSTLIDNAQQYGAAMALRRGDSVASAALLRQYLRNAGGLRNVLALSPDPAQAWIDNRHTGMGLPMQAAGFYMQEPDTWERIVYRDLGSEAVIGLTSGMRIPESDAEQEALLRKALVQQFKLQPGVLRKQRFVSQLAKPDQAARVGQHWVFEVQPIAPASGTGARAQPDVEPVRQALFWLVDQGDQRAILRASAANPQQVRQAQVFAQALRW